MVEGVYLNRQLLEERLARSYLPWVVLSEGVYLNRRLLEERLAVRRL